MLCSSKIQHIHRFNLSLSIQGVSGAFAWDCIIGRLAYPFLKVFSGSGLEAMLNMTRLLANKALHTDAAKSAAPVSFVRYAPSTRSLMTIAINVLLVLLGAIVAAFGDTHNPNASHLQRLNTRGWIIVISVFLALVLGVAKEYSADHDQAEQRQLLKDIFASREADHQLLASLLQSQSFPNGASAKANEYQSLLN